MHWVLGTFFCVCGCLFLKIVEPTPEEWSTPISNLLSPTRLQRVSLPFLLETLETLEDTMTFVQFWLGVSLI